jgi:hypothetical protein
VIELTDLFKPFNYDRDVTFRCDRTRALWQRVTPADQERLWWAPETIDWRDYWIGTHFEGLQQWVFPTLDDEFGPKPRSVYTYKDLLELWDATTKLHKPTGSRSGCGPRSTTPSTARTSSRSSTPTARSATWPGAAPPAAAPAARGTAIAGRC